MGKKGKRSKQKATRKEADKIIGESDKLLGFAASDFQERLFSKAANQYREVIRLLDSKKELMVYTGRLQVCACFLLMTLEYRRRNYKAAFDCYSYNMANLRHMNSQFRDLISLYYQMIMLRLSGQECKLADFIHFLSREDKTAKVFCFEAILAFRAHKMYDSAIRLEMACGSFHRSAFEIKISLALTYLEQYRLEFHHRSEMREKDFSAMNSLITSIQTEYPIEDHRSFGYCLVVAQWYYLIHTLTGNKEDKEKLINTMKSMVGACFSKFASSLLPYSCLGEDKCYTCGQATTHTEVQYICSGCRVACYCSIDHQRMTWKKEAVMGMHIGHEILCPLYKALRKLDVQLASEDRDKVKESRIRRRLEREFLKFLEYGLDLKDKCFPCEYQKIYKVSFYNSS